MSESSTAIGRLFDTQRTIIDRTFETQETINRQGLDLTRNAVKPVVEATVGGDGDAEAQVDDAFERLDETQADLLEEFQFVAEQPVDTSERAAQWSADFVESQVERLQEAEETAEDVAEDVAESTEELAESAEETTEDAAEAAQDTVEETANAAEQATDSVADVADDVVDELQDDFEEAAEEFDELGEVDETAAEGLAADGIESLSDLASAQVETVADAGYTTQDQAEEWIEAAVDYEGVALADLEGIGETYSDRLNAAGIRTVDQLARTSAAEVAEVTEVDEDRAAEWVQQAQDEA